MSIGFLSPDGSLRPVTAGPPDLLSDRSSWTLTLSNVITAAAAWLQQWSLADIMLVYWVQSVVIGGSYVARILHLEHFSTANFKINGKPVDPTPATKRQVAAFFCLHYGFFHVGYLVFLFAGIGAGSKPVIGLSIVACSLAFVVNHVYSYRYHLELDRAGTPNIGTMMFTPYLRVVPMHLTIVLGGGLVSGRGTLLLFMGLKTVADVIMHKIEHRQLGRSRA